MIVGLGIDIVELYRITHSIERFGMTFARKILHPEELEAMPEMDAQAASQQVVAYLASRLAAKEAGVKALGTGFSNGVALHDVRVVSLPSGQPEVLFSGKGADIFARMANKAHLSLSHGKDNAVAVVVLERLSPEPS